MIRKCYNKLNPRVMLGPEIEPGPQWWEESAFTTVPTPPHY